MQIAIGLVLAWMLYREHGHAGAQEGERIQVQAKVVEENLVQQLQGANNALKSVALGLNRPGSDLDGAATTGNLKLLTSVMPGVSTMLVLDAQGTIVSSSRDGLIGKNFKDREYFDLPRRSSSPAVLYVSPPFKSSIGTFVVVISRAMLDSKGAFAGVVAATLDPAYFSVVLKSVLYAPDMWTTLIHGGGKVFLNMPLNELALNDGTAKPHLLLSRFLPTDQSSALITGRLFNPAEERLVALRNINHAELQMNVPLVVAVSRELSNVYLPWRNRVQQFVAAWALFVLASWLALYVSQRRRHASAEMLVAVMNERQAGAERVELALRGADLGLWDLDVPSGLFVVNARERELLGFSPDEPLPQGAWKQLIHPDDLAQVDAAILPHLRGEAATYDCEHRMRHKDGRWIWLFSRAMIVERGPRGAPVRIIGTHLDVTERKRVDAELALAAGKLRDSEEQLRQVTDNMPALVSRLDLDQRFRFSNRAYRDWLGMEPSSLIGRSLKEVYGEHAYGAFQPHVEAALGGNRLTYEHSLITPFGTRQVEVTLIPERASDGSVEGLYALTSDITARHEANVLRMRSEERLSLALEGSQLALFDWDIRQDRLFHSAQASVLRGEPAVETNTPAAEMQRFVHPDDVADVLARMKDAVTGTTPLYQAEFRLLRREGEPIWIRALGRVVERDAEGRAVRLAGTYADINERKVAEARLRRLAEFDTLTDLPNRALFHDRLHQAMLRAARGKPMALLFLDVDHFKAINDTLGHDAGDQLLKIFARRMQAAVRQSDTVARLAGDEFTIILEGLTGLADAKRLAEKLGAALREPIDLAGRSIKVTASIGVALCDPGDTDDEALLRRADAALYETKRRGRDGYFFDGENASAR